MTMISQKFHNVAASPACRLCNHTGKALPKQRGELSRPLRTPDFEASVCHSETLRFAVCVGRLGGCRYPAAPLG